MDSVLQFLQDLRMHNDRTWFEANRARYTAAQTAFNQVVEQLIPGIASFDGRIRNLTVPQCTYRIYRDLRFSPDKTPYKTHFGAYICPGGKNSGYAGYYFHLEPSDDDCMGNSLIACGLYCPDKAALQSVREEIMDNGAAFNATVRQAEKCGFTWDGQPPLKKIPQGFPVDAPYGDYLKRKDFCLFMPIPGNQRDTRQLLDFCLDGFRRVEPFNSILNRAVAYAYGQ
ncbi:MAG: DUF2461 domain-containing protein [Bacteroidales bacterium]|nr:DUF2461 domain-containing protein [Bacteroidales bacterium]